MTMKKAAKPKASRGVRSLPAKALSAKKARSVKGGQTNKGGKWGKWE
jgi:hypothetical protein